MHFKLGDKVAVIDDALSGRVTKVCATTITIETNDGFEVSFAPNELVKIEADTFNIITTTSVNKSISKKNFKIKNKSV